MQKAQDQHGISLIYQSDSLDEIHINISVSGNPIYPDPYCLRMKFTNGYPIDSPETVFVKSATCKSIPLHPHIYSNGHICLDLLYSGWSPVQGIVSLSMSIQSMLAGNSSRDRPPDDADYVRRAGSNPKKTNFVFQYGIILRMS